MMREPADEGRSSMFLTTADVRALYLEKNVSEQCATGNGGGLIPQVADGPTGRFKREELGLGHEAGPSILALQATVRDDNRKRGEQLVKEQNKLVKQLLLVAKKRKMRTFVRPVEAARGCTGCASCVPETRLRPHRIPDPANPRTFLPRNVAEGRRQQRSIERRARAAEREQQLEQLLDERDGQLATVLEQRRHRRAGARTEMSRRRDEQKLARVIVRRSTIVISPGIK